MPAIVIGADTIHGMIAARALTGRRGEVRAFLTDPEAAAQLRAMGVKVAIGDVSDASHIEGAAHQAFTAVLIAACAGDGRERAFADSEIELYEAWGGALARAGVHRAIWVGPDETVPAPILAAVPEAGAVDTRRLGDEAIGAEVARLDDLASMGTG